MDNIRSIVDGKIDFQGQRLADRINQEVIVLCAGLAFLVGYQTQSMALCMGIFSAGFAACLLLVTPPWPFYNKHSVQWLPNRPKSVS